MRKTVLLLAFVMFLTMTGYGVILPALPYLASHMELSSFQMGSLITAWALTQFLVLPLWGKWIDQIGRKFVLLCGLSGFGLAFLLMVFADSYTDLLVIRILGAMVSAGTQPAVFAFVADHFSVQERGQALAKMGAANSLGFLCGPAVGGLFSPFGVYLPFIVAGSLALCTVPLIWLFLREPEQKRQAAPASSLADTLRVASRPGYLGLFVSTLCLAVAASSIFSMLGYYMIHRFDATPQETGFAFSLQSVSAIILQLCVYRSLSSRMPEGTMAFWGFGVELLGYACVGFAPNLSLIWIGCALIGAGQAIVRPTLVALLSRQEHLGQGITMGLQQAMDSLGRSIGPLIAGLVFSWHSGAPFLIAAGLCALMLLPFAKGVFPKNQPEKRGMSL